MTAARRHSLCYRTMIINSDESKEGDGYICVQCSYKPWLHTVCAINIILDSSEQPQHAQLATQIPHTVEPLLKDTPNKGHNTFNLCIKDKFCGPHRTMAIQFYL